MVLSFEQELRGTTGHIFILVSIQTSYIVDFDKKYAVPIGHVKSSFGHEKVMENHFCKRVVTLHYSNNTYIKEYITVGFSAL